LAELPWRRRGNHDLVSPAEGLHTSPPSGASDGVRMFEFLGELWAFLRVRKKFWLLPIVVVMGLVGALIVLGEGSVLAPFIYALF
jgi:hypothetical protein